MSCSGKKPATSLVKIEGMDAVSCWFSWAVDFFEFAFYPDLHLGEANGYPDSILWIVSCIFLPDSFGWRFEENCSLLPYRLSIDDRMGLIKFFFVVVLTKDAGLTLCRRGLMIAYRDLSSELRLSIKLSARRKSNSGDPVFLCKN